LLFSSQFPQTNYESSFSFLSVGWQQKFIVEVALALIRWDTHHNTLYFLF
jgi:hypothetical protein